MIYTTLKANKEHEIDNLDIVIYCEQTIDVVANIFEGDYYDKYGGTDFDKLLNDFTERQVASAVLKYLKSYAKEKDSILLNWTPAKVFIDLEYGIPALVDLIKEDIITNAEQLRDIEKKAKTKGFTLKYDYEYDKANHYYKFVYVEDLIDKYFPCYAELNDTYCNNCGNCQ